MSQRGSDGESQEFVQGDSLLSPKGFTGTYQTLGNYRELIVIEREGYEAAYGAPEESLAIPGTVHLIIVQHLKTCIQVCDREQRH